MKHFRMEGGSYLAMAYDTPVHYRDAAGLWQDYDNTLQTVRRDGTVSAYRVENGQSVRTFAADAAEEQLLTAQYGAYALCLTPVAAPSAELPVQPTEPVIAAGVEEPEEIQAEPVTEAEAPGALEESASMEASAESASLEPARTRGGIHGYACPGGERGQRCEDFEPVRACGGRNTGRAAGESAAGTALFRAGI